MENARQAMRDEALQVVNLFKNALCYTLAFSTVQDIEQNEADLVFVGISVCVCVFGVTAVKTWVAQFATLQEDYIAKDLLKGPLECVIFLLNITLNVLTQLLSTLLARWIVTLPPQSESVLTSTLPVATLSLALFWALLFSVSGAETMRT